MNIVNVGYDSTNYYVLAEKHPLLLIDVGFPGTIPKLQHQCKRAGVAIADIPYLLCTHYHPDHAGLAQELKQAGCKLILLENQIDAVPTLRTYVKPEMHYVEIMLKDNVVLSLAESRAFLARIGIKGEIIATLGHSDDSVSLILDEGVAFTGDLTHPLVMGGEADDVIHASWAKIRALGVKTVYGGHGPVWQLG